MKYRHVPAELFKNRNRDTTPQQISLSEEHIIAYKRKVTSGRPSDCWMFESRSRADYPRFRGYLAHRIAYHLEHGSIPEGMTIDHLCMNKWCNNPGHLEAVTVRENALRASEFSKKTKKELERAE